MSDIGFGPAGDPPIVNHYPLEDGYGRITPLVDRRLLEQAQARIQDWRNKVSGALGVRPGEMNYTTEEAVAKIEDLAHWKDANYATSCRLLSELTEVRKVLKAEPERECNTADAARRVVTERDHWRAEAEKARTPDADSISISPPVIDYLGEGRTVASMYEGAADKLDRNMALGGSNMRASVARTLRDVASALRRQTADRLESEVVEKVRADLALSGVVIGGDLGEHYMRVAIHGALDAAGLLRGDR